jgi:hypothetical protein
LIVYRVALAIPDLSVLIVHGSFNFEIRSLFYAKVIYADRCTLPIRPGFSGIGRSVVGTGLSCLVSVLHTLPVQWAFDPWHSGPSV